MATTILRNDQLASIFYGANNPGQPMTMIPKLKYMFYAEFELNANAPAMDNKFLTNLGNTSRQNISFKIKTIDKPKIDLTTVEMNQYNHKRLIYTKTDYQPFTIKLHDAVDGSIVQLWKDYFTYYFADSRPKTRPNYGSISNGPAAPTAADTTVTWGTGWGLSQIAEDTNFFYKLNIYSLFGGAKVGTQGGTGQYQLTSYINPRITAIDFESYDASSSDTEEVSITLKYEAIEYNPITQGVLPNFGYTSDSNLHDVTPTSSATVGPNNYSGPPQSPAMPRNAASVLPTGQNPNIFTAPTTQVSGAPTGYAVNQTGSSNTPEILNNTQNSISSSVTANAGMLNFGNGIG